MIAINKDERLSKDAVVANVKACDFEHQHLPMFVVPQSTGHVYVDASDGGGRLF
jgi:hypothetical protein